MQCVVILCGNDLKTVPLKLKQGFNLKKEGTSSFLTRIPTALGVYGKGIRGIENTLNKY